MNNVQLIGNLTRDPELGETAKSISFAKFTIAVTRPYTSGDNRVADFFNIVAWRGLAENCGKWLSKGSKVGVIGRLENNSYTDKNGDKRTVTNIVAEQVEFLNTRQDVGGNSDNGNRSRKGQQQLDDYTDDDLPF